jgi:hypothetical protein
MLTIDDFTYDNVLGCRLFAEYNLQRDRFKLPPKALNELRQLLDRDDITNVKEYKAILNQILESQYSWHWQLSSFLSTNGLEILIIILLWIIFIFLYIKFNLKKPLYELYKANINLLISIIAAFGYFFVYIEACAAYSPVVLAKFPYTRIIFPLFATNLAEIYNQYKYMNLYYFFFVYFIFTMNKFPKNRFIRFHWMYGLIIDQIHHTWLFTYYPLMLWFERHSWEDAMRSFGLGSLLVFLMYFVPPLVQALKGKYIEDPFIREAVEMHLGRDNDPDFKWWDRKK